MLNGIDVSSNQAKNICELVSFDFAIVKATGNPPSNNLKWDYKNEYMRDQVDAALRKTGLAGLYHFTYGRSAKEEADLFCDHVKDYIGRVILVIDYEDKATENGREWIRTFIKRVKERTGVNPIVYASSSVIISQNLSELCKEENCGIWSANYYAGYKPINGYSFSNLKMDIPNSAIWQYTSTGYLNGWNYPLDLDVFFGDREAWLAYAKGDGSYYPPETPENPAGDPISVKVDGIWGRELTTALQTILGTPIDGEIWGQNAATLKSLNKGGLSSASWKTGKGGSACIKELQKAIGMSGNEIDGLFGKKTCKQLQKYLGTAQDGEVWNPSPMVKALQERVNSGRI